MIVYVIVALVLLIDAAEIALMGYLIVHAVRQRKWFVVPICLFFIALLIITTIPVVTNAPYP